MTEGVIDQRAITRLLDVVGGDPEFLQEMIEEFDTTAPELVESMRRAAAEDDLDRLRISAHTLKSNSREFGASALSSLCERLEHACRDGTLSEPDALITEIFRELDTARSALADIELGDE